VTAIGTGGRRYAKAFIEDESVPFDVLLDEDGSAAELAGTGTLKKLSLVSPRQLVAGTRAVAKGNRQHNTGRRPLQLGATLVIGPGDELRYEDFEEFAGDHANLDDVLGHL
jgi:hypothetical protein